jgi:putative DNA primase/helicase
MSVTDPHAVRLTVFQDRFARTKTEELIDLAGLCTSVRTTSARAKGKLPLLKLATFGDLRSSKDSLRHNANVLAISGIEADYDGERVCFEDACTILSEASVAALAYTSPSHTEDSPRWRVLCPFSKEYPPSHRDAFMGRLNGLFRGIFSVESWTLSQSFYLGSVNNNPSHRAEIINGTPIDLLTPLDETWIGRPGTTAGTDGQLGKARPVGSSGLYVPVSGVRLERYRNAVLDTLRRDAVEGQKHARLLAAGRTLGGIQAEAGFSDADAVQWLLDALPDTVEDWVLAASTAVWALAKGREQPFTLEDRPRNTRKLNGAAAMSSNGIDHEAAAGPSAAGNSYSTNGLSAAGHDAAALSDDGIITEGSVAAAFARAHGDALRFDHDSGSWLHWDGAIWRRERTELAYRWAHQRAKELAAKADNAKAIISAGKASFAAGVERLAQSDRVFAVTSEIWDADPWLLGTPGGTVDLKTGELRPARQGDFITKQTGVTSAETPDCPMWLGFLDQACGGDAKYIRFLQQWSGYCLTGSVREHAFLLIHGSGGNGKSVWLNTVGNIIGDYCVIAAMDTFIASKGDRHPTDLAALRGARMVCASETEEGRQWSEARIKQLTGGDKIAARFMRQDFFEYTPNFKLTMSANHQPELRNVDDAVRRRVRMGPFLYKPATPDTNLEEKLRAEWPGILRWMIDGCHDWQINGLVCPDVVTASTAEYFDDQDLLTQWIEECCDRTDHKGKPVADTLASLIASWRGFAKGRGEEFSGSKGFSSALQKRGFTRIKDKHGIRGRGILGMRVRFETPPPDGYGGG